MSSLESNQKNKKESIIKTISGILLASFFIAFILLHIYIGSGIGDSYSQDFTFTNFISIVIVVFIIFTMIIFNSNN